MKSNVVVKKQGFFGRLALVTVTTLALVAGGLPGCAAQEQEQEEQSEEAIDQSEQAVAPAWVALAAVQGLGTVYFMVKHRKACEAARIRIAKACGQSVANKVSCAGYMSGTNTPQSSLPAIEAACQR